MTKSKRDQCGSQCYRLEVLCIHFLSAGKDHHSDSAGLAERSRHHRAFKGQEGGPDLKGHAVPE